MVLKELAERDCVELLASQVVGRVAVVVEGRANVLPVNYILDNGYIVFRTDEGTKLDAARAGAEVTFEVDKSDPLYHTGWSVMATGRLESVTDPTSSGASVDCPYGPGAATGSTGFACRSRRSRGGASAPHPPWPRRNATEEESGVNVLVLESEPGVADGAITQLTDRGHHVSRCHESARPGFPCRALEGEGRCPLADPGIDVAVTVRDHPGTLTSVGEDGVSCALRARVPLVVAGRVALHPYEDWADEVVEDGNVADACERVAAAPVRAHTHVAQLALRDALRRRAGSASGAEAAVWRDRSGLRMRLDGVQHVHPSVRGLVAADVAAALRDFDSHAPGIDISFGEGDRHV